MNFEEQIDVALHLSCSRGGTLLTSVLMDANRKVYLVGKNDQSMEIARRYKISGLIDDLNNSENYWNGIPVVRTADVDPSSIIINCVTSISPVLVRHNLKNAGLNNQVSISDLISGGHDLISLPCFVAQQREELKKNTAWWSELWSLMSDQVSKKSLIDVLRFRLTANFDYMNDYTVRLHEQYFEDFMQYKNEVFVDAGGFDGDTTEQFITRYPDYKKVYLFEPSSKNMDAAKRRLQGRRDIIYKPLALSDNQENLYFNADAGSASAIIYGGGESISGVTLDNELEQEQISFIKMDLEGWEMKALRGAEITIMKKKPKLAIAVYHAAKDFREIPQYILKLNPEYKIYLRHYSQGWSETVMYFC